MLRLRSSVWVVLTQGVAIADRSPFMVFFLAILGLAAVIGLAGAMAWGVHEIVRNNTVARLERRLNPSDVLELDQAFARVQRDVLFGD